jgi:GNAT superfamily N-acetyltransferase
MEIDDMTVGYFAINGGHMITLFTVFPSHARYSQALFARVKKCEQVTNEMVPNGDEQFLRHCFDDYVRIEKQAYVSIYTDNDIPESNQKNLTLKLADMEQDAETLKLGIDFLADEIQSIKEEGETTTLRIYIAYDAGVVVGFGVIDYGRVVKDIASIGMFVIEEYRQQGYASNLLQELKIISKNNGCRAFSGCWYYNHNSLKSMHSAMAYSKTRLLKFHF